MTGLTTDELAVGDVAALTRKVTADGIREFVGTTGDDNPLHSDPDFAATTRFGEVIAPGMLTGGLLSAVIGTQLPGPGVVYLSQSFRFLRPVYVGDTITARVEVTEIVRERNRVGLRTTCLNQRDELVLEGEAWVMPSKVHVDYQPAATDEPSALAALPWTPATYAIQMMSLWTASALALAAHAVSLYRPRAARP
jgi:3-hydroxybutyryl-CoA dehydratase